MADQYRLRFLTADSHEKINENHEKQLRHRPTEFLLNGFLATLNSSQRATPPAITELQPKHAGASKLHPRLRLYDYRRLRTWFQASTVACGSEPVLVHFFEFFPSKVVVAGGRGAQPLRRRI